MVAVSLKKKKNFFFFFFFFSFFFFFFIFFFFQAEDGIRDLVRSRGLGDVYKRQASEETGNITDRYVAPQFEYLSARRVRMGGMLDVQLSLIHI